ncbi:hypothetical protein GCM10009759_74930 [Kitasatospora saccharophila]|uniref:Uncharacterized protein n=1 Tax=Kitasatospora saccharophila TaxID=407973 RepID=A0ABP5K2I1_9ACTN
MPGCDASSDRASAERREATADSARPRSRPGTPDRRERQVGRATLAETCGNVRGGRERFAHLVRETAATHRDRLT